MKCNVLFFAQVATAPFSSGIPSIAASATDTRFLRFMAHETGRFRYGDLHENGHHLFCARPSSACGRDLRKSQSMSDLKDACSSCSSDLVLDSDHAHVENPEERAKMRLANPMSRENCDGSLDMEESDGGDIESVLSNSLMSNSLLSNVSISNTDQGASSEIMGEMESPLTDLEVCGILNNLEQRPLPQTSRSYHKKLSEPSFQLVVDEGTDKDESLSTEHSSSSQAPGKNKSLRIHISPHSSPTYNSMHSPNSFRILNENTANYETDTGIPNSPTLYISGVSICRSPEPRSPKSPRALWSPRSPMSPYSPNTLIPLPTKGQRSASLTLPSSQNLPRSYTLPDSSSPEPRRRRINRSGSYNCAYGAVNLGNHQFLTAPQTSNSRLSVSPQPDYNRTRSSSLNVPGTTSPSIARMKRPLSGSNVATYSPSMSSFTSAFVGSMGNTLSVSNNPVRKTSLGAEIGFHGSLSSNHRFRHSITESHIRSASSYLTVSHNGGSSLSLQPTRASSPLLLTDLRLSKSASEYEKSKLVFQFPNSPVDGGTLSSVLHVEESNLSSDGFHETLFINKSPRSSKRKKSKKERNRDSKCKDVARYMKDDDRECTESSMIH